jgi:hypothetical protein
MTASPDGGPANSEDRSRSSCRRGCPHTSSGRSLLRQSSVLDDHHTYSSCRAICRDICIMAGGHGEPDRTVALAGGLLAGGVSLTREAARLLEAAVVSGLTNVVAGDAQGRQPDQWLGRPLGCTPWRQISTHTPGRCLAAEQRLSGKPDPTAYLPAAVRRSFQPNATNLATGGRTRDGGGGRNGLNSGLALLRRPRRGVVFKEKKVDKTEA